MQAPAKDIVANLSWDEVAARIEAGAAAVLPVGAGAKEHGLHLPMNTDQLQADWLGGVIAQEIDTLVWPALTYGFYPAFVNYAGSLSLTEETFSSLVAELVTGLIAFDAVPVLIVDTGISTIRPIDELLARKFSEQPVHHFKVYEGPRYRRTAAELQQQPGGTHADELETSRMLMLAPDAVGMDRAAASPPGKGGGAGPLSPSDPSSPNYSPSGSWGDPTLATREKGEALQRAIAEDVAEMARRAVSGQL